MTTPPTGRLIPVGAGHDLVLSRTYRAPVEDVWASVTESERTARWFGPWEGDAAPGNVIRVRMDHEDQTPWCDLRVDACEPPHRLALSMSDAAGDWHIELLLAHDAGQTELRLVFHLDDTAGLGETGPGWEYYLDMLTASRSGRPLPDFAEYYPSLKPYYDGLR
ncbi:ATPase [Actinophytocola xinjiangensis]|uniref:ATPase n=1 Tax=Actinophytocola xinjiangensis TaxID=485602 RepID=A0A7Z0WG03_9PSEU|nr:SRPBCC family protein [Actinophytocola xinjiangensis]OLF05709.1 ATPase [Actinophytocola xinjiangensis]